MYDGRKLELDKNFSYYSSVITHQVYVVLETVDATLPAIQRLSSGSEI
jgi:hypothetical protein